MKQRRGLWRLGTFRSRDTGLGPREWNGGNVGNGGGVAYWEGSVGLQS